MIMFFLILVLVVVVCILIVWFFKNVGRSIERRKGEFIGRVEVCFWMYEDFKDSIDFC